jgi:ADP-ribosylglycohydrolase
MDNILREFKLLIILAGGDTDTNGAVAGGILGMYHGLQKLPLEWINSMPYSEWLESLVDKLLYIV